MKITAFDELYTQKLAGGETSLGGPTSGGSNGGFGGDVVGTWGDLSVVGLRSRVSLSSNINPTDAIGDVLQLIAPGVAQFATPSNSAGGASFGSNSNAVGTANAAGASSNTSRADHVHMGVASIAKSGSAALVGAVTLTGGTNVTLTQSGQDISIAATGTGASYPASIEGLFAWYKADAITGLSNGATMTEWRNSAPLTPGLDLIAIGAPTYQTNVQNSLPVVRFGGSAYFAHNLGAPLMANKPWTIFIVHKLSSIANSYTGLWGFGWSDAGGIFIKSNGKSAVYATGSIYDGTGAITYGTSNWNYTTAVMGPTVTTRRNGSADITAGTMAINGSLQGLGYLGNQAAATRVYNGDIAEVLLYARVLNSTEYAAVESYISAKWNI